MNEIKITRLELYDLVWTKPISKIAHELNINAAEIVKACTELEVPRPKSGHWTKIECGKTVSREPLPKLINPPKNDLVLVSSAPSKIKHKKTKKKNTKKVQQTPNPAQMSKDVQPTGASSSEYSKETKSNQGYFKNASKGDRGILIPNAKKAFDLRVTKESVTRALTLMDSLIKAFKAQDWKLEIKDQRKGGMTVIVKDEEIEFYLIERTSRKEHILTKEELRDKKLRGYYWGPKYDYSPTGELSLIIEKPGWLAERSTWKDGKRQKLEDLLNDFCTHISILADNIKKKRAEEQERDRLQQIASHNKYLVSQLREQESKRRKEIELEAKNWEQAESLRKYVKILELNSTEDIETTEKIMWIKNYADLLDPTKNGTPSVIELTEKYFRFSKW
ncbi:hypothetical protein A3767_01395 [Oleiphilus sp. HI0133]|nr:hypothetical protein A3767_01395 [Oleiphilus sp. HI0133]